MDVKEPDEKKEKANEEKEKKEESTEQKGKKAEKKDKKEVKTEEEASKKEDKKIVEIVDKDFEPEAAKEMKFVNQIELTGDRNGEHLILNLYQTNPIETEELEDEIRIKKERRLINRIAVTGPQALRTAEKIEDRLRGPRKQLMDTISNLKKELVTQLEDGFQKQTSILKTRQLWLGLGLVILLIILFITNFASLEEMISAF